jgi:hypothetical protein
MLAWRASIWGTKPATRRRVEAGAEFPTATPSPQVIEEERGKAKHAKVTREQIVAAVEQFGQRVGERAGLGRSTRRPIAPARDADDPDGGWPVRCEDQHAPLQVLRSMKKPTAGRADRRVLFCFLAARTRRSCIALSADYEQRLMI